MVGVELRITYFYLLLMKSLIKIGGQPHHFPLPELPISTLNLILTVSSACCTFKGRFYRLFTFFLSGVF